MGQENSTEGGDVTGDGLSAGLSKSQTLPLQKKKGKKQRPTSQPVLVTDQSINAATSQPHGGTEEVPAAGQPNIVKLEPNLLNVEKASEKTVDEVQNKIKDDSNNCLDCVNVCT